MFGRTRDRLERRIQDLEHRLDELAGFVVGVAAAPPGAVSDGLRGRARELLGMFDTAVRLRIVEPDEGASVEEKGDRLGTRHGNG